jgi:hypothetical protein
MNPTYSVFEPCDNNQTTSNDFEPCDSNQKTGRGGARKNSGMKSTGIETVTVRIDKRLLNVVTAIKQDFKDGKSLDDIISKPTPKNDDAKLLKKIAKLEREKATTLKDTQQLFERLERSLESNKETHAIQTENLKAGYERQIDNLHQQLSIAQSALRLSQAANGANGNIDNKGLDEKTRKRLIQFCHPDRFQGDRKAIADDLVKKLNELGG